MTIHSHARCDFCEAILVGEPNEAVDEGYLLETGWVTVTWQDPNDEDMTESRDFCSFGCAGRWSAKQVSSPVES